MQRVRDTKRERERMRGKHWSGRQKAPLISRIQSFIHSIAPATSTRLSSRFNVLFTSHYPLLIVLCQGEAYHQDLLVLSIIVFALSFLGLPWVCGATVQSLNHVRSMANVKSVTGIPAAAIAAGIEIGGTKVELSASLSSTSHSDTITSFSIDDGGVEDREKEGEVEGDCESEGDGSAEPAGAPVVAAVVATPVGVTSEIFSDVIETRLTGFVIHGAILSSLFLLPFLGNIPVPVISGIFLYLGKKMMKGNLFLERLGNIIIEKRLLPATNIFNTLPAPTVLKYLTVQSLMLLLIWVMKQNKNFSLFFPSCIAFLMIVRSVVMPNFFSAAELHLLDPEM
jgi:hypothetical protein